MLMLRVVCSAEGSSFKRCKWGTGRVSAECGRRFDNLIRSKHASLLKCVRLWCSSRARTKRERDEAGVTVGSPTTVLEMQIAAQGT